MISFNLEDIQSIVIQSIKNDDVDYSEIYSRVDNDTDNFNIKIDYEGVCEFCGEPIQTSDEYGNIIQHTCNRQYEQIELLELLRRISDDYGDEPDLIIYINDVEIKSINDIITLNINVEK